MSAREEGILHGVEGVVGEILITYSFFFFLFFVLCNVDWAALSPPVAAGFRSSGYLIGYVYQSIFVPAWTP